MKRIEYNFLHWGPFTCHYKLDKDEIDSLRKLKEKDDWNDVLAGHLNHEKSLDRMEVFKVLAPYYESYVKGYHDYRKVPLGDGIELKSAWINRQKKNEFNPPHTHDDDLSFVAYTEIPDGLEEECRICDSSSSGSGCIVFDFNLPGTSKANKLMLQTHAHLPEVGDLFIFPASLPHWVYPFKTTEGERVSISGNLTIKHDSKKK